MAATHSDSFDTKWFQSFFQMLDFSPPGNEAQIRLFQFADVHCRPATELHAPHRQWCDEITLVYSGRGETIHNGRRFLLPCNAIHLCHKEDVHQLISDRDDPLHFFCIGYMLEEENPLYPLSERLRRTLPTAPSPIIENAFDLFPAFQAVRDALYSASEDALSRHIVGTTLNYILIHILQRFLKLEKPPREAVSVQDSLVLNIIGYLHTNLYNIGALQQMSGDMGYSYSYLSHLFSQKMGQTLSAYFTGLRMEAAHKALQSGFSVTSTAEQLGYSSIHAFSRAYKAYYAQPARQSKRREEPSAPETAESNK